MADQNYLRYLSDNVRDKLLGSFAPTSLQPYHRVVRFRPTGLPTASASRPPFRVNLIAADPTDSSSSARTPQTMGLIIVYIAQSWLKRGDDPSDPNAYSLYQPAQGAYGRFSMTLAVDNRNVGEISETIYDYASGTYIQSPGWTDLNRNLLWWGANLSPVIYVPGNTKLEALFYQPPSSVASPWLDVPDAISVELNGYSVPAHQLSEILKA